MNQKIGEFGRIERQQNLKRIAMDGVKFGKIGKLEICKIDEEMCRRSEENLCKSILKGLANRSREKHAMLADVEEEQEQDVICIDDITGKELLWHAVRQARELELKYLRDLGVYEKDDRRPWQNTGSLQWTQNGSTQTKRSRESPCRSDRECVREFESDDRPDMYARAPPLEALKAIISVAANNTNTFSIMHIDVSRAYFHAKAQRPVLIWLPVEDRMGADAGKVGLMKKSMYGTRGAARNWERDWQGHVQKWGFQLGLSSKNLLHHKEDRVPGLTHGDEFVLTGPTEKLMEVERKMTSVYPIKAKVTSYGSSKSIKTLNRRLHWRERERNRVPT